MNFSSPPRHVNADADSFLYSRAGVDDGASTIENEDDVRAGDFGESHEMSSAIDGGDRSRRSAGGATLTMEAISSGGEWIEREKAMDAAVAPRRERTRLC